MYINFGSLIAAAFALISYSNAVAVTCKCVSPFPASPKIRQSPMALAAKAFVGTRGFLLAPNRRMERFERIHFWKIDRERAACCGVLSRNIVQRPSMRGGQCRAQKSRIHLQYPHRSFVPDRFLPTRECDRRRSSRHLFDRRPAEIYRQCDRRGTCGQGNPLC